MKKLLLAAVILALPTLAMADSITVKPTYDEPSTECRAQSIVSYTFGTKTGSYDFDTTGVAKYKYRVLNTSHSEVNIDVFFGNLSSARWRSPADTIVPNATSGTSAHFRNLSSATAKTLRIMKCH